MKKPLLYAFIIVVMFGCTPNKHHEESAIRDFLISFENSLAGPDSVIRRHFANGTEPYAWPAIRLLQNHEEHLQCSPRFAAAEIITDEMGVSVILPVGIAMLIEGQSFPKEDQFIRFQLSKMNGKIFIESFDGNDFYSYYTDLRADARVAANESAWMRYLQPYVERAKLLVSSGAYDSVAWFCRYDDEVYYYVLKEAESAEDNRWQMGLVNEQGKVIVPAAFDRIGTPGLIIGRGVETYKDGQVGLYSLVGSELLTARHTWIAPYQGPASSPVMVVARYDNGTAWLDKSFSPHDEVTDQDVAAYVERLGFLELPFNYSYENTPVAVKLSAGSTNGFMMPANYLVHFGLLDSTLDGFIVTRFQAEEANYGTLSDSSPGGTFIALSDGLRLLISNFKSKFLGGRSDFYYSSKITVVLPSSDTLRSVRGFVNYSVRKVYDSLIEASVIGADWPSFEGRWLSTHRDYFRLGNNGLEPLSSSRRFAQSQFVSMDSSYLYVQVIQGQSLIMDWDPEFIELVRLDILFDLGLGLEGDNAEYFNFLRDVPPKFKRYEDAYAAGSEIDKYNLDFIERLIGPYPYKPAVASPATP